MKVALSLTWSPITGSRLSWSEFSHELSWHFVLTSNSSARDNEGKAVSLLEPISFFSDRDLLISLLKLTAYGSLSAFDIDPSFPVDQWFPTCGTRRTDWGYAKIILAMAENTHTKKLVKITTQKQSYGVLVYKQRLMWKLSLDPPTTSHLIILMPFLFVLILF
jgi:hypothetical protein